MSIRAQIKKEGEYPSTMEFKKEMLKIDNKTIILSTSETNKSINIYLGGEKHWCLHCELSKDGNQIKEEGYLIKIRYDMLCSVEESIQRGGDMTKLLKLLIQHIHNTYPAVKCILFNDSSTRRCDNGYDTNLAVMTYLYSGKTWYEKNFYATIAQQSKDALQSIVTKLNKSKEDTSWSIIKEVMYNYKDLPFTEKELESHYTDNSKTWIDFFEPIVKKIGVSNFCIFISPWIDSFILKYFNNLMGLTYALPIMSTNINYVKAAYIGGRYKSFFKRARRNKTIKQCVEME
jgi:hypothetical protein